MLFAGAVVVRLQSYEPVDLASATTTERAPGAGNAAQMRRDGDPGVLVAANPEGRTSGTTETPAQVSAREQRYRELLNSAPPPAPAPKREEKPSLLDRVVTPIANVLGMRKAQPAATPKPQPPPVAERAPSQGRAGEQRPAQEEPRNPNEDDPETDITPPQLLAADFNPTQVHDGEETIFSAMVNDNLSGVRSVSGVITSPSGSMQGFACTRDAETNRFFAKIAIPKDAPEGVWTVKYLTLSDNASNSVNLNVATGALPPTARFTVISSTSDASGPTLKAVRLDKLAMRAGDRNTVFVDAEDEKSGVSLVSGVFVSPSKAARIGFGCRASSTGTWECTLQPPVCLDCGVWRLEQIQLQDKANNLTTFRTDNPIVGSIALDISADRCDAAPPVVTALSLDPLVVSNAQASVIEVKAIMVDEGGCGVASLSGQAVPPGGIGGQRRYFSFEPQPDGQTFIGKLEIPQFAAKGMWSIAWIQALDKGHNLRAYSSSDRIVSGATFRVE